MQDKNWRQTDTRRTGGGVEPVRVIASEEGIGVGPREFSVVKSPAAAATHLAQADARRRKIAEKQHWAT
jgi:hypothetical protein